MLHEPRLGGFYQCFFRRKPGHTAVFVRLNGNRFVRVGFQQISYIQMQMAGNIASTLHMPFHGK